MRTTKKCALLFLCALFSSLGAGCSIPIEWSEPYTPTSTPETVVSRDWVEVDEGIARFDARVSAGEAAARLIIWRIRPEANLTWELATSTKVEGAPVAQWMDEDASRLFVLNAGYFHDDHLPSGWVQKQGKRFGKRSFDADRSAYVLLGDTPRILSGSTNTSTIEVDAFQSYPWLIRERKTVFTQETGQYARRTFVGVDTDGVWYVGVVPSESVTLFQLAQLLSNVPTKWRHVINLDGGPSTGLMARVNGEEDRFDSFGSVLYTIVARRRP